MDGKSKSAAEISTGILLGAGTASDRLERPSGRSTPDRDPAAACASSPLACSNSSPARPQVKLSHQPTDPQQDDDGGGRA
jgi:hypothetical protein